MTAFGDRIEAQRQARGLSLRAFGAAVQMSHGNLAKILNGRHGASEEDGHQRLRPPTPPLGKQLEMWFDVLGTKEEDEPLLRMLASAAHVPDDDARAALETLLIAHFDQVVVKPRRQAVIPRHAAESDLAPVPSTRSDAEL